MTYALLKQYGGGVPKKAGFEARRVEFLVPRKSGRRFADGAYVCCKSDTLDETTFVNKKQSVPAQVALQTSAETARRRLEPSILAEAAEKRRQLEAIYRAANDETLEKRGYVLLNMLPTANVRLYGEFIWTFQASGVRMLKVYNFKPGQNVIIRPMSSSRRKCVEGTVLEAGEKAISISLCLEASGVLDEWFLEENKFCRVELAENDTATRRQLSALERLAALPQLNRRQEWCVRAILLNSPRASSIASEVPSWFRRSSCQEAIKVELGNVSDLNKSQILAVKAALTRTFTLWQGPPGTGKTRTILSFLRIMAKLTSCSEWKQEIGTVLAVADTNTAADNILEGLLQYGVRAVRIGQPSRVRPDLRYACVDAMAESSLQGRKAKALRDEASRIYQSVREAKVAGRISAQESLHADKEARKLWAQADAQLAIVAQEILASCSVVVATCSGAGEARLQDWIWRVVVIDEATQATEPSTLVALTKGAECVVMAGDHAQLPPTVISQEALRYGNVLFAKKLLGVRPEANTIFQSKFFERLCRNKLNVSLFARLQRNGVPSLLLTTQYRMHPAIAQFPSLRFYGGKVSSGVSDVDRPFLQQFPWPSNKIPVALIDCNGKEERVSSSPISLSENSNGGPSFRNRPQADVVMQCVDLLMKNDCSCAILSPYNGQVRYLSNLLLNSYSQAFKTGHLVVSTIDGFQGREADVVVISTVRCNEKGSLGFLADPRRMNVAITRARRGLVVIGCKEMLQTDSNWGSWIAWVETNSLILSTCKLTSS